MEICGIAHREKMDIRGDKINATLSTTNPTWHGLGLKKRGRIDDKKKRKIRNREEKEKEGERVSGKKKLRTRGK
jgi:hypothetical protein